ncbi:MAG: dihydroneopterin aldolase [Alphaproteobacteria bacterium]|nr:dihydroneopterin aldolase [Alphaproteobacteria bacterium]
MPHQRLTQPYPFCLNIDQLSLPVHLGVTEAEQEHAQTVYMDMRLYYPTVPDANSNDGQEYLCYDALCQQMLDAAQSKPIALIEFLLGELYRAARAIIPNEIKIYIKISKPLPESLMGYAVQSAAVEYTDLLEGL